MNKFSIGGILSLALCLSLHAADSYVWLKNNTPISWKIKFEKYEPRQGDKLEKGKKWNIGKTKIGPWYAWTEKDDALLSFENEKGKHVWTLTLQGELGKIQLPELGVAVGTIDKKVYGTLAGKGVAVGAYPFIGPKEDLRVKEKEKPIDIGTWKINKGTIKGLDRDYVFAITCKMDGDELYIDIYDVNPYIFPKTSGDKNKINVVVYNVYFINAPGVGKGRDKRALLIPPKLKDADVVIFCEVFDDESRGILLEGMQKQGFKYSTAILGSGFEAKGHKDEFRNKPLEQPFVVDLNSSKFKSDKKYQQAGEGEHSIGLMDGGVIIVSKYPFKKVREWVYEKGVSWDAKAHKGAIYAVVDKDGKDYHIFGTHPQAPYGAGGRGENLKQETLDKILSQYKTLRTFIESQNIPKDEPVLIGGDLNIDKYPSTKPGSLDKVLKILKAEHPKNIGFPYSADKTGTLDRKKDNPRQLIDHVVYLKDFQNPKDSFNEVLVFRTEQPWDKDYYDLSDHYAVLGYFKF